MNFEYMKNFMDSLTEWIIPGNSVVIYKDGKKVFEYSSGYSDLEKKIKKTGEEQLYIYSCSKVAHLQWYLLMNLIQTQVLILFLVCIYFLLK